MGLRFALSIGTEIADPMYTVDKCLPDILGHVCRYSDSAYEQRDPAVSADPGFIARPTGLGSLTIPG